MSKNHHLSEVIIPLLSSVLHQVLTIFREFWAECQILHQVKTLAQLALSLVQNLYDEIYVDAPPLLVDVCDGYVHVFPLLVDVYAASVVAEDVLVLLVAPLHAPILFPVSSVAVLRILALFVVSAVSTAPALRVLDVHVPNIRVPNVPVLEISLIHHQKNQKCRRYHC